MNQQQQLEQQLFVQEEYVDRRVSDHLHTSLITKTKKILLNKIIKDHSLSIALKTALHGGPD